MRVLVLWVLGLVIATLLVWAVGTAGISEVSNRQWNELVGDYIVTGRRSAVGEGRGTVCFRDDGIQGVSGPFSPDEQHVVFWGDSFVESFNVGDEKSLYRRFTELARAEGYPWRAVAVAQSGRDISHHIHLMPFYRERIPNLKAHVLLFSVWDVLPNGRTLLEDARPVCRWAPRRPGLLRLRPAIQAYRLQTFWELLNLMKTSFGGLRVRPGPAGTATGQGDQEFESADAYRPFWRELLKELTAQAGGQRVVLMYHPRCPQIKRGRIVYADDNARLAQAFMQVCAEQGVEVLDLTRTFADYTRRTSRFAHGFSDTFPGKGHWNEAGHRLIAKTAFQYLVDHPQPKAPQE